MADTKQLAISLTLDGSNFRAGLGTAGSELRTFDQQLGRIGATATSSFGAARAGLTSAFGGVSGIGDRISIGVTLPLLAAGGAAVKLSNDFGLAFAHMVGLAGVPQAEVEDLKKSVLDLAGQTAQAPVDLANALYFVESAGIHGSAALDTLRTSAMAAEAGMGDVETVADALTSILSAYGTANITAAQAGDILTVAVRDGKAEAASFAPELGRLLPMAVQLKIPFSELAGSLAFLTRSSGDTALSATQLSGILNSLLAPSQQAQDEMQQLGVSVDSVQKSLAENGLAATLQMLREKLGDNSNAMHLLFPDVRALNGALGLTGDHAADLAVVLGDTTNATGALADAAKAAAGTPAMQLQQAFTDLQVAAVDAGGAIAPFVTMVVHGVADVATAFSMLPGPAQTVVLSLAAILAASGPIMSVGGRLATAWGKVSDAMAAHAAASAAVVAADAETAASAEAAAAAEQEAAIRRVAANEQIVFSDAEVAAAQEAVFMAEMQRIVSNDALIAADEALVAAETEVATSAGLMGAALTVGAGVGIGALLVLADQFIHNAAEARAAEERTKGFTDAIRESGDVIAGTTTALGHMLSEHTDVAHLMDRAGVSATDMATAFQAGGDQSDQMVARLLQAGHAAGFSDEHMFELVKTLKQWSGEAPQGASDAAALGNVLGDVGLGGKKAAGGIDEATASMEAAKAAQAGLIQLTDQLAQAFDKQYAAMLAPSQLHADYEAGVDGLVASLRKNKVTLDDATGAFEDYTDAGRSNLAALDTLGTSIEKMIVQRYQETGSIDAAKQAGELYVQNLRDQLEAAGYNTEQIDLMIQTMHLTPEDINTTFSTNAVEAQIVVGKYIDSIGDVPTDVRTEIETLINQDKLDEANFILNLLSQPRTVQFNVQMAKSAYAEMHQYDNIQIPGNARGTQGWRGGWTWVGEEGAELVNLPTGTRVLPHGESVRVAGSVGNLASGTGGDVAEEGAYAQQLDSNAAAQSANDAAKASADASKAAEQAARDFQTAVHEQQSREDVQFKVGLMSNADYRSLLEQRMASTEQFSQEWYSAWQGITSMDQAAADAQKKAAQDVADAERKAGEQRIQIEDNMYKAGAVGTENYLATLRARLDGLVQYSDEYMAINDKIASIEQGQARDALDMLRNKVEFGVASVDDLKKALEEAETHVVKYSNEWAALQREIDKIKADSGATMNSYELITTMQASGQSAGFGRTAEAQASLLKARAALIANPGDVALLNQYNSIAAQIGMTQFTSGKYGGNDLYSGGLYLGGVSVTDQTAASQAASAHDAELAAFYRNQAESRGLGIEKMKRDAILAAANPTQVSVPHELRENRSTYQVDVASGAVTIVAPQGSDPTMVRQVVDEGLAGLATAIAQKVSR